MDSDIFIDGYEQETSLSATTTAVASNAIIDAGVYQISTDVVTCYLKIAATAALADDVTTSTGFPLYAGNALDFRIPQGYYVGAITATGTATVRIHRVR